MIITIDGPSGTGKSTVAKRVAEKLGFAYFDTGAMYRALTYIILQKGMRVAGDDAMGELLKHFTFRIVPKNGKKHYFVGEEEVTDAIRSPEVTKKVSEVSALPFVRTHLVDLQRRFGEQGNAVFEGRDIGTVVFPEAELKVFLTASSQVRAERRFKELVEKDPSIEASLTLAQVHKELVARDTYDSTREVSPLRQAEDAVLIDTSNMSVDAVVEAIIKLLKH